MVCMFQEVGGGGGDREESVDSNDSDESEGLQSYSETY